MGTECSKSDFYSAIENKSFEEIEKILEIKPDYTNIQSADFITTPLCRAVYLEEIKIIKILLEKGADIDLSDSKSYTPLMWASKRQLIEIIEFLIEKKADVNKFDFNGLNALNLAIIHGNYEAALLLLKKNPEQEKNIKNVDFLNQIANKNNWRFVNYEIFIKNLINLNPFEQVPDFLTMDFKSTLKFSQKNIIFIK